MAVNAIACVRNTLGLSRLRTLAEHLNASCPPSDLWFWDSEMDGQREMWSWDGGPPNGTEVAITPGDWSIYGGGMGIHVHPHVFEVWSLARWRGFLGYPELRAKMRPAFAQVIRAIGGAETIWVPGWFSNEFPGEGDSFTLDSVRHYLLTTWGPAQASLEFISDAVVEQTEHGSPRVWFEERID